MADTEISLTLSNVLIVYGPLGIGALVEGWVIARLYKDLKVERAERAAERKAHEAERAAERKAWEDRYITKAETWMEKHAELQKATAAALESGLKVRRG